MTRFRLPVLLFLCLTLALPAMAADDPVVVSVGLERYGLSEVQAYYDALAASACENNGVAALTEEQAEQLREAVAKQYVFQGVVRNMYAKLGLDVFTDAEEKDLKTQAQTQFDEALAAAAEGLRAYYPNAAEEKLIAYARATLDLQEVTVDTLYAGVRETALLERIMAYVSPGLTVTDEQVEAAYVEKYIAVEKEAFAGNVYMYELYTLEYGYEARYIPAGYRYCEHILLDIPTQWQLKITEQQKKIDAAYEAAVTAEGALSKLDGKTDEEKLTANDTYQEAYRAYDAALAGYEALKAGALEAVQPTTDAIAEKFAAGATFDSLIDEYSTDENLRGDAAAFLVHAESVYCEEAFRDAAMAIVNPGDISAPVFTKDGVHILYYVKDAPEYLPMDDTMRQAVAETLYETLRYDALIAKANEWQQDFEVFAYPELIDITAATTEKEADAAQ